MSGLEGRRQFCRLEERKTPMCVIIHRPAEGHQLTLETLRNCWDTNSHGWGIMFADQGVVHTDRGMDWPSFEAAYARLDGKELGIHFRIRTHGATNVENTHPFQVLDPEWGAGDVWLMHNGIIKTDEVDKGYSDTWHYARYELAPILYEAPGLLKVEPFLRHLEDRVGYSKLLILDGDGQFTTIGAHKGKELFGCWFSNEHSHKKHVPTTYTYYGGGGNSYQKPKEAAKPPLAESAGVSCDACVLPNTSSSSETEPKTSNVIVLSEAATSAAGSNSAILARENAEIALLVDEMQTEGRTEEEIQSAVAETQDAFRKEIEEEFLADQERFFGPPDADYDPTFEEKVEEMVSLGELDWETLSTMSNMQVRALVTLEPKLCGDLIFDSSRVLGPVLSKALSNA